LTEPEGLIMTNEQKRRSRGIYLLPNLFTTAALLAGFYSIVCAYNSHYGAADDFVWYGPGVPDVLVVAVVA